MTWTSRLAVVAAGVAVLAAGCSQGASNVAVNPSSTTPPLASTTPGGTATTAAGVSPTPAPGAAGTSPVGVVWDYAKQEQFAPHLERLRGGTTWYELEWCQVQPDPNVEPNWARADKNLARAKSVGIVPMLRLRVGSCWATGGEKLDADRGGLGYSVTAPPVDESAYQAFVRSVVERYRPEGVTTYSIENEVNGDGFWRGTPAEYEALVRSGAEAIHQADPTAKVVDSGLSSTTWGVAQAQALLDAGQDDEALRLYDEYYERRFARREEDFPRADTVDELREALDTEKSRSNREYAEVTFRLAQDGVIDAFQLHFYEKWTNVPALMDYLRDRLPDGTPIDVWEAGLFWPDFDGDQDLVAGETARLVYMLLGNGASSVIYLPMQSNSANTDDEIRFGLVDAEFQPRAGFEALAGLAEFARNGGGGWSYVTGPTGARAVVGEGAQGAQALVWTDGPPIALEAPEVTVSTLDGTASAPATGSQLTTDPVVATAPASGELRDLLGA